MKTNRAAVLDAGQAVSIIVGEDAQSVMLSAWVVADGTERLTVQIDAPASPALAIPANAFIYVIRPDGSIDRALVAAIDAGQRATSLELLLQNVPKPATQRYQRRFERFSALELGIGSAAIAVNGAAPFGVDLIDLSQGGACLLTPNPIAEHDAICFQLPLLAGCQPDGVIASIAWVHAMYGSWMIGIEFRDLNRAAAERLEHTIRLARASDE